MSELTWGLLIATKDRLDALKVCVELALTQTCPPVEVIVVDSSAGWKEHARIIGGIVADYPDIRFVYEKGAQPSLTVQRNQAIDHAQADIVFMIDDDSYMFPECAEHILQIYAADTQRAVGGIQATLSNQAPDGTSLRQERKKTGGGSQTENAGRPRSALKSWLTQKVFLMSKEEMFIPYGTPPAPRSVPSELEALGVKPATLFHGCRMTFRREVIARVKFSDLLRYYCPGEDLDASYRVFREALLLKSTQARLHHYNISTGRIDRYKTTILSALNQAVLLSLYADDSKRARQRYFRLMWRRVLAEFLKDGLSRRFSFPQLRGILATFVPARQVFDMPSEQLETWYLAKQEEILKG